MCVFANSNKERILQAIEVIAREVKENQTAEGFYTHRRSNFTGVFYSQHIKVHFVCGIFDPRLW